MLGCKESFIRNDSLWVVVCNKKQKTLGEVDEREFGAQKEVEPSLLHLDITRGVIYTAVQGSNRL